ncbi:MAG TPA: CHAD domain-containing protein [Myxococcota bacterium]|nr:CHAD domain-containing protein [Myxococcota bacterium]
MVELERTELLRPAEEGARLVALRQLDEARAAIARAGDPGDEEAVHDARVALRRLRSTLASYRGLLDSDVAPRALASAGRIAGQMGGARDTEVWLAWLLPKLEALHGNRRQALEALKLDLESKLRLERAHALEGLGDRFEELEAELRASLSTYTAPVTSARGPALPSFALAASEALRAAAAELERALATVIGPHDAECEHQARIAAKRVRYVLEPIRRLNEAAVAALTELKKLQDLLGERHDRARMGELLLAKLERASLVTAQGLFAAAHAHDERAARSLRARPVEHALLELVRSASEESDALFAELAASWLSGKDAAFRSHIAAIAESLRRLGAPAQEIERKYLLHSLPERVHDAESESTEIEQGYLPGGAVRERLRRAIGPRGTRCTRTVKVGTGRVRAEYEEEIAPSEFARLWPLTEGARLRKRRYRVPDGSLTWEVDEFLDRPLVLAEIELPAEDTEVVLPEWLTPSLVREVTGETEYSNAQIASG